MRGMRYSTLLLAFALMQCVLGQNVTDDSKPVYLLGQDTLSRVGNFGVLVEDLGDDAKALGLTEERIKTAVELRLRSLGISVRSTSQSPYLYVRTNVACSDVAPMCAANIEVSMTLLVALPGRATCDAPIWNTAALVIAGKNTIRDTLIRDYLIQSVDRFANNYLAVHPKK